MMHPKFGPCEIMRALGLGVWPGSPRPYASPGAGFQRFPVGLYFYTIRGCARFGNRW